MTTIYKEIRDGDLFVWAMVDKAQPLEVRFRIFGTGQESVEMVGIPYLVWHVFHAQ